MEVLNSSGHTALDIAKFWNHEKVVKLLAPDDDQFQQRGGHSKKETVNFFSNNPLDRAAHRRKDGDWLKTTMMKPSTKYILLSDLQPFVIKSAETSASYQNQRYKLCIARHSQVAEHLESEPAMIFLGLETKKSGGLEDCAVDEQFAWFALDMSSLSEEKLQKAIHHHGELLPLMPGLMQLDGVEAAIFGQARSLLAWHNRYQFCPTCGTKTIAVEAGYKRQCTNDECRSLKGMQNRVPKKIELS